MCLFCLQPVKCHVIWFFLKQLLFFSGELKHFMEKCNHDSRRLHDIKTLKWYIVSVCGNVTAEAAAGDKLCFPGLLISSYCFHLFIYWIPVNIDYMLLLSFTKLNLKVGKLNTTKNIYFLITGLLTLGINFHLPREHAVHRPRGQVSRDVFWVSGKTYK